MRFVLSLVCALAGFAAGADGVLAASVPIVIAHRGASGYLPEHTASAYRLAIQQGADYVEPDLVMTKDGVLVARHENEIGRTTDVASHPEFASRKTTRLIDGESFTGWFVEDFTFAELKTLRSRERNPGLRPASARHDGEEAILSLQEIIDIAKQGGEAHKRPVGLYIELKNPTYHAKLGLPMEGALVKILDANGLNRADASVFIESFWPDALMQLRALTKVRLTFLMNSVSPPASILKAYGYASYADVYSPEGLAKIARFANVVGSETGLILPRDGAGRSLAPTGFVEDAHKAGLAVHVWSLNTQNAALPLELRRGDPKSPGYDGALGDGRALAKQLFDLGVDGLFTDQPDIAIAGRDEPLK